MSATARYHAARRLESERALDKRIEHFAQRYDRTRETLVLIPGLGGSRLDRALTAFDAVHGAKAPRYDAVWLDEGLLTGDIRYLEIDRDGRDRDGHLVIPDGPVGFLIQPYDSTQKYFTSRGYNFVVFGYDWRRPPDEAASQLLRFLQHLHERVVALHGAACDPLRTTTLAAHSLGGIVAVLLLQLLRQKSGPDRAPPLQHLYRVVTVGTPFYGTTWVLRYYYGGVPLLNQLYGPDTVTRVISSFSGPVVLHLLDRASYAAYATCYAQRNEAPELERYPYREAGRADQSIDPYAEPARRRYPAWVVQDSLDAALRLRQKILRPLSGMLADKLFHIRNRQLTTCNGLRWHDVDGCAHRPGDAPPFEPEFGAGDGTAPYWSARLAYVPRQRVFDVQARRTHAYLMEDAAVLAKIEQIMTDASSRTASPSAGTNKRAERPAPGKGLRVLEDELAEGTAERDDPRLRDRRFWRRWLNEFGAG